MRELNKFFFEPSSKKDLRLLTSEGINPFKRVLVSCGNSHFQAIGYMNSVRNERTVVISNIGKKGVQLAVVGHTGAGSHV